MAKGSMRLVLGLLLLLPLLFAGFLRCNLSSSRQWMLQLSRWPNSLGLRSIINGDYTGTEGRDYTRFLLRRLVRGQARRELRQNGVACISDKESDICITTDAVRIVTASASASALPTVYLTAGQRLPFDDDHYEVRPYPRKTDSVAMSRTSPVRLLSGHDNHPPACDVVHPHPAVVFSNGGFAGNFFHDISDVIIPLFITASYLRSRVTLVITDFRPWWVRKYHGFFEHLSSSDVIAASSSLVTVDDGKVHCFPAAVVGLKYHGNLACNATEAPGGLSIMDFRLLLHSAFNLSSGPLAFSKAPVLVMISRRNSRSLLNEAAVVELAKGMGFKVIVATPEMMSKVDEFAEVVNTCSVLIGVHGAGLTNMVFLRPGGVLLQVTPWGLDWAATAYFGRPARAMGLRYVEHHIVVEESTLYGEYPKDHPVLVDPWSINRKGYRVSRPVYTDGQNVSLNLSRFRETLQQAQKLLPAQTVQ